MLFPDRTTKEKVSLTWMLISLAFILLLPLAIGFGLVLKSLPVLENNTFLKLITQSVWLPFEGKFGFLPFIMGSLYVTFFSFIISAPLCLFSSIYLTQYAKKRLLIIMQPVIDILAGIPSVVYGVWGILIVVPFVSKYVAPFFGYQTSGYSVLAGSIVLSIMTIPFVISILIEVFNTSPVELIESSMSLGATRWETIKYVLIKRSFSGIIAAFGLGISKAFGETIAVLMVVGNMIQIPDNIFKAAYPLPALIANNYGEMMSIPNYDSALMFAALILFIIVLLFNLLARIVIRRKESIQ
jgi:phosphate transport system permease protein